MEQTAINLTGRLSPRDAWTAEHCPIAGTLDVVGARSSYLLLREAFYGCTRFDDFARRAGISEPVAAARLRELVDEGLLARAPYREPGRRTREEYRLTEKGAEFFPVLVALLDWGSRWLDDKPRVELRHHACGGAVTAELRCANGHGVEAGELDLVARRGSRPA
jgi:DNA-binding HxlR family transcriptional regulator